MHRSLVPQYVENHKRGLYGGLSMTPYVYRIGKLIRKTGARTILDYGCGKAQGYRHRRWHHDWGEVKLTLFDPAVAAFAQEPEGKFDGVLALDVLEHIPRENGELDATIAQLVDLTGKWAFIAVCCRPAHCKLPDGRNEHVTIEPPIWWRDKLGDAFDGKARLVLEFSP
jgi:hypothetical protein